MENPYDGPPIGVQEESPGLKVQDLHACVTCIQCCLFIWNGVDSGHRLERVHLNFSQYTMEDLLERIQGSQEEIEAYLQGIHACKIDGKYCCVSIAHRRSDFWQR